MAVHCTVYNVCIIVYLTVQCASACNSISLSTVYICTNSFLLRMLSVLILSNRAYFLSIYWLSVQILSNCACFLSIYWLSVQILSNSAYFLSIYWLSVQILSNCAYFLSIYWLSALIVSLMLPVYLLVDVIISTLYNDQWKLCLILHITVGCRDLALFAIFKNLIRYIFR